MKQPVEVELMGQRLTVTSDDSEAHVRQVASYVDRQIRRLAEGRTVTAPVDLVLLTALNIASEYWKLQQEQEQLCETISRLSKRISAELRD
jgi:cell division protein ZapA